MKLLYLAKTAIPARTANSLHVMKMCQAFANNGHDVWLNVLSEKQADSVASPDVFQFYNVDTCFRIVATRLFPDNGNKLRFLLSHFLVIPYLIRTLREVKPDLVYGRDIFSCYVAACFGYNVIAESHFPLWHGKVAAFAFKGLQKKATFKKLIVISEALRRVYLDYYSGLSPEHVLVAHDGSDPVDGDGVVEKKFCEASDRLQVGYVGHLYKGKGVEVIAAIAPQMHNVDFHIIGGLDEDIKNWKQRITTDNVTFHGFVQQGELPAYISGLDVCLLPNQYKVLAHGADPAKITKNISLFTSPLKMFEYMAYGKAIIASDLPVLREVLNGDIAILVKPDDYHGWIDAINSLQDENLRTTLGNTAREVFLKKYTWQKRAESVLVA